MPAMIKCIITCFYFATLASTTLNHIVPREAIACNNAVSLCSKNYDQVVHLGAHDSPFRRDSSTGFSTSGNQYYSSTIQLAAGIRLLTAQVHKSNGQWRLCHSICDLLDVGSLSAWLAEIKTYMDTNPNEVVTILLVNSDGASRADLHQEFQKSKITEYAYRPASDSPPESWPTLQDMISANTRLVTFVASLAPDGKTETSYLMDEFTFIFENKYDNIAYSDFSCAPDRPVGLTIESALGSRRMPFMNHFLYEQITAGSLEIQTPDVDNIGKTNGPSTTTLGSLGQSGDACTTAYSGRPPTFILVDFCDEGPALETVDRLNGVTNTTGRTQFPARDTERNRKEETFAGVRALVNQVKAGERPSRGAWIWGAGKWSLGGINLSGGELVG